MANFYEIPAELRNILYAKLLKDIRESKHHFRPDNQLALFSVSKQLHDESTSYFYQQNDITINALSAATETATILPPISDKYLRFLRCLTIHTATGQANWPSICKVASRLASLPMIGADFDQVNILVTSKLSHLLNSRVDDSIMDTNHPITVALRQLLESRAAKTICIELENAWFAPGVASSLANNSESQLQFFTSGAHITNFSSLERPLTGRYSSTHLSLLGLEKEACSSPEVSSATSVSSTPSSFPSSLCSAFASLDTFSVTSFEMGSEYDDDVENDDELFHECDASEQPFFSGDDIEEWQASTQDHDQESATEPDDLQALDVDEDEEMEDVSQDEISSIMLNLNEASHHAANAEDLSYLTNFVPDLLLSRHHLGHLI